MTGLPSRSLVLSWLALLLAACSSNEAAPPSNSGAGSVGSAGSNAGSGALSGGAGVGGAEVAGSSSAGGSSAGTGGSSVAGLGGSSTAGSAGMAGSAGGSSGSTGIAGSAGASGSGGATGFGIGGPSRCASAGVALCEDFENGLNASIWTTTQSGDGTAVVDGMHAARGSKALHVKTATGAGHAFLTEKMTFPASNNILYGRMFVWLGDAFSTDGHFSLAEGAGTGNAAKIRFGGQNKFFGVGTDGGSSGDWTDKDNKLIPTATFICAEFQFKADTNEFHASWDDVERPLLNRGVSQHGGFAMPAFTSLWFGYWMYNMTEPQELWIDEIAVDFKPIGCTR
jgi:hypothetical protein